MADDLAANKALVRRYVDEVQNGHRIEAMAEIFAADTTDHMNTWGGAFQGANAGVESYRAWLAVFPDLASEVRFQVAEGDKVVSFKTLTGTHRGTYHDVPATGRRVRFTIIDIFRIQDGRITDYWGLVDEAAILEQIGALGALTGPARS